MTPSKDWMAIEDYINDEVYKAGVDSFLDYAFKHWVIRQFAALVANV